MVLISRFGATMDELDVPDSLDGISGNIIPKNLSSGDTPGAIQAKTRVQAKCVKGKTEVRVGKAKCKSKCRVKCKAKCKASLQHFQTCLALE